MLKTNKFWVVVKFSLVSLSVDSLGLLNSVEKSVNLIDDWVKESFVNMKLGLFQSVKLDLYDVFREIGIELVWYILYFLSF